MGAVAESAGLCTQLGCKLGISVTIKASMAVGVLSSPVVAELMVEHLKRRMCSPWRGAAKAKLSQQGQHDRSIGRLGYNVRG